MADLPDMSDLLAQAQSLQAQLAGSSAGEVEDVEIIGSAGGGAVRLFVNGDGRFHGCEIDPAVIDPGDADMLSDLVLAAVNDAVRQLGEHQAMGMSGGIGDLLGGLGLDTAGGLGGLLEGMGLMGTPTIESNPGTSAGSDSIDDSDVEGI